MEVSVQLHETAGLSTERRLR